MPRSVAGHWLRLALLLGPLFIAGLAAAAMWLVLDHWWVTIPLGYGPRWIWWLLVPVPLCAPRVRRATRLWATALTASFVAFMLVGVRLPVSGILTRGADSEISFTLVAFNAGVRGQAADAVARHGMELGAEVIAVVECPRSYRMAELPGYHLSRASELCLWTRMPLATPLEIMPRDTEVIGWSGSVLRTTVVVGELSVPIGFVHLRSVRNELSEFLDLSELPAQADSMASRLRKRVAGSMTAAEWLAEVPLVVGDFNLVPESPVFRRDWGKYHSAWGVAGVGTGRTWASRWFGLRIDHVMAREPVRTSEVHIGNGFGSDHRPVIAELRIRD